MNNNTNGIYHEKIGIVIDELGDKIAFTGSLNETQAAHYYNFESIDVFCSWHKGTEPQRVNQKINDFQKLWNNKTDKVEIYDCPEAIKQEIFKYKNNNIISEEHISSYGNHPKTTRKLYQSPEWFNLRDYQKLAIDNWINNDGIGYFNMATGTGKTLTALAAVESLIKYKSNDKLFILIVCPYMHLVEQWSEDLEEFYDDYIKVFSKTKWEKDLRKKIHRFNLGVIDTVAVITTNSSFTTNRFQKIIKEVEDNLLIIVDEVHNAGTGNFSKYLDNKYDYRLGLSATPERYFDDEGTSNIINFFQKEVFSYSLEKAIKEGFLTEYYYHPIFVYLTENEYEEYKELTRQAIKCMAMKDGKMVLTESAKRIYIKRARLIAGMENKTVKLKELLNEKRDSYYNLVYCGATYTENENDEQSLRQIIAVSQILGNDLGMKVKKFTADENLEERNEMISEFSDGISLQTIVAIKCLDEGVNIPSIKNAYILSSSTNPKEFIQRRGRVLRKYEGKDYSNIYDFIALPRHFDQIHLADENELNYDVSLLKKEIKRANEFTSIAKNKYAAKAKLDKIIQAYEKYIEGSLI
jgi:superfamily II DNA or RNA helicase